MLSCAMLCVERRGFLALSVGYQVHSRVALLAGGMPGDAEPLQRVSRQLRVSPDSGEPGVDLRCPQVHKQ